MLGWNVSDGKRVTSDVDGIHGILRRGKHLLETPTSQQMGLFSV